MITHTFEDYEDETVILYLARLPTGFIFTFDTDWENGDYMDIEESNNLSWATSFAFNGKISLNGIVK